MSSLEVDTMSTITAEEAVKRFRALVNDHRKMQDKVWELCTHPQATPEQIGEVVTSYRKHLEALQHTQKQLLLWLDKKNRQYLYGAVDSIKLRSLR